jgi:hypothetical protein
LKDVYSFDELWRIFAQQIGAQYCADFEIFETKVQSCNADTVIVVFSAWDLDYKVRNRLAWYHSWRTEFVI